MKSVGIVTDSHGGISQEEAAKLGISVVPVPFFFGEECFYEGVSITRAEFFERLRAGENVSTSQPSPESVMNVWRESLKQFEKILYMPLSSGLSGSCNTARMLAGEDEFEGKVFVVDNGRISTPMHRAILDALELIKEGYDAEEIQRILEKAGAEMSIYIAVETLEYLKKGGRITAATAALGTILNIKPILKLNVGLLETHKKCRGMKKARKEMLEAMKQDLETKFKEYYERNEIYMMAASSADEQTTREWVEEIKAYFPGMEVLCDDLSLGISCHTGEGALGVGCSCKPKRKK
ncbi:MAG: DegV family protein [Lachnospiraceae bacterium]|nr:DegV family protein [Lachnospiraceae bacterium]